MEVSIKMDSIYWNATRFLSLLQIPFLGIGWVPNAG